MAAAHVEDAPGLTIGDLADLLEVGQATAGQLVDRMVRGGWVERSPSPDDRRAQIVTATSKARAMLEELAPRQSALEHEIFQDLSADERRALLALLERIKARLEAPVKGTSGMERKTEYNIWYWVVAFIAVLFIQNLIAGWQSVAPISYSQFEKYLADGKISSVAVGSDTITGTFAEPVDGKKQFVTTVVNPAILERIDRSGIEITGVPQNTFLGTLISWVAPALIFFGIWMLLFRKFADKQGFGGFMQVGRSKAKVYMEKKPASASPTWPVWTRPRPSSRRSWSSSRTRPNTESWAHISPKAYCSLGRRAPARRCWRARWRVRPA